MPREETIQIKIDKSLANKSLSELRKEAAELRKEFGSIKVGDSVKAITDQAKASQAVSKAAKEQANVNRALASSEKELQNAVKARLSAQKEAQNVVTARLRTEKEAQNVITATARAEKAKVQALAAADKAAQQSTRSMQSYGNAMMSTIKQLVGFTGVVQSMRSALTEMKNMSDEMVTYRKVTNATAQEMENIRKSAYKTAKTYGQSPSDFLASASNMARAGYGANSVSMAELATKTQLVGDMTAEAASKFLLAVDAGYKYKGNIEQLNAVLDAANEIDNNYATSISKISEGMTLVASLAGSVHVPIEQLTAALGTMTATTQRSGSEMARGLRSIFLNVLKDTSSEIEEGVTVTEEQIESLTDALEKYGDSSISAARKAGKLINPMEAIASLAKSWKAGKLDEQTLFGISKDIAGQRYYNAFSALIQNYDMYESMLKSIGGSAGSAQKEVNSMLDSWSVKFEQLKTTWVELANNTISENFIKNLIDGGKSALEFAGNLENLAIMAGGAYAAIQSLSSGINNLKAHKRFGGFNFATMGISLGIAAVGAWKSAYEKNIRDAQEAAAKAVANAAKENDTYKTIQEIQTKYLSTEKGDLETLKSLQEELNAAVGDQASAVDLVNGKYDAQKKKLQELTENQRKAAIDSANVAIAQAVSLWNTKTDLNGAWRSGNSSGIELPGNKAIEEYLKNSKYFQYGEDVYWGNKELIFSEKPRTAEGILEFYKEYEDFYNFLGTHAENGEKASQGVETLGIKFGKMYQELGKLLSLMKEGGVEQLKEATSTLEQINKASEQGSAKETYAQEENQITNIEQKFRSLSDVIRSATEAKEKFDEAMKSSKADAMNDYITAFKTLKEEMKLGKVNSNAYYAAARMLLGDEAYAQTGGTSAGVRKALNKKGGSGSIMQAYDILSATYKDKNGKGKEIEGYGIYELLKNTKGLDVNLKRNGKAYIPKLTDDQLSYVSKQWGGLSKDTILNWLNAFDQYDKSGKATDKGLKTEPQKTEEEKNREITGKQIAAAEEQTTAIQENTDALNGLKEQLQENNKPEETGETGKESGKEGVLEADNKLDDYLEKLEEIGKVLSGLTVSPEISPELTLALQEIEDLKRNAEIIVGLQPGARFETVLSSIITISAGLADLENKERSGIVIDAQLKGSLESALKETLLNVGEIADIDAIYLALEANDLMTPEIDAIIQSAKNKYAEVNVDADASDAQNTIHKVEDGDYKTTVDVEADAKKANKVIADVKKPETKTITIEIAPGKSYTINPDAINSLPDNDLNRQLKESISKYGNGYATGTRYHHGGPALVNDGTGPELIVDRGRAFIAGHGRPAVVNLGKGAKVFTAGQTRSILNNGGAPAYAEGARDVAEYGGTKFKTVVATLPQLKDIWNKPDQTKYNNEPGKIDTGYDPDKIAISKDEDDNKKKSSGSGGGSSSKKKTDTEAFNKLSEMINYILGRIQDALDEQLSVIDKQIDQLKASREAAKEQNELEEKQKAVADAQKDLMDAMSERTVRYLGEDGKWHWMADQRNVKSATENLQSAQKNLSDYQSELAFNQQVQALEDQKTALQEEYNNIAKIWSDIQAGVNTPTGTLSGLLNAVLTGGTAQEKTGAKAVKKTLIGNLKSSAYKKNYSEALSSIAKATAGNPLMPGDSKTTLASLIAANGGINNSGTLKSALAGTYSSSAKTLNNPALSGSSGVNYNYYVNGVKIGNDAATTMPLSEVMRGLAVYSNGTN